MTLINESDQPRRLRLTTYGEVALAEQAADQRHPAFAKLFVESEYLHRSQRPALHAPASLAKEEPRFLLHMLVRSRDVDEAVWGTPQLRE